MKLNELLKYDRIVIQGHDNPDADAVAASFGLYRYFLSKGKNVRMIYSGKNRITKTNLVLMLEKIEIPIEYVTELEEIPDLLVTVDCQYGERNVTRFEAGEVAVIDHHMSKIKTLPALHEVRENYGSCATLVWDMMKAEGYPVKEDSLLSTALYYGLFMDTAKLQEIRHPKDKDMRDELEFCLSSSTLTLLENSNLSQEELLIAGRAMSKVDYDNVYHFAISEADKCDPNILGIISDALIEVDSVGTCVVLCAYDDGVKLSVRSCERETRADELAAFITAGIGSGGGHMRKSGGFLVYDLLAEEYHRIYGEEPTDITAAAHVVLKGRMKEYYSDQDYIYSGTDDVPDLSGEPVYQKKRLPIGYVKATDLYPEGTLVTVRMLEGDVPFTIKADTYFMIGVDGEVYKNDEDYFLDHNLPVDEPYVFKGEYAPTIRSAIKAVTIGEEESKSMLDYVKTCIPKKGSCVYARRIEKRTKVFVPWSESYLFGTPGDFLAARKEDPKDVYIINKNIMFESYEEVKEQ